jgi:enoyl-CoA hydratase
LTIAGHKLGLERAVAEPDSDDDFETARSAAWASSDAEEGRTAFLDKRRPEFTGH